MFRRRRPWSGPEDPSVSAVERMLSAAGARSDGLAPPPEQRPVVTHALWICSCVTTDDAPTWLIYVTGEGAIGWCRVPERIELLDLVDARLRMSGHAAPAEVVRWLQGNAPDPWGRGGHGHGDGAVLQEVGNRIRRLEP